MENMTVKGPVVLSVMGTAFSTAAAFFGGWDTALQTLILLMLADYMTGLIVAGVFKRSTKTETGALESRAGLKGLSRKGAALLIILIACRLDMLASTHFVRDTAVMAYCINEMLSIVENAGLMGVPIPAAVTKAIDILKKKTEKENGGE